MEITYFHCFSGISGNMTIGSLLDLGVDNNKLLEDLSKLYIEGYDIKIEKKLKKE